MNDGRPPKRPRTGAGIPGMDDDQRAEIGLAHRRAESLAFGVPIVNIPPQSQIGSGALMTPDPNDPLTEPYVLIERALSDDQEETFRRLKRPTSTPANLGHVIKSIDHTNKAVVRLEATDRTLANSVIELQKSVGAEAISDLQDVVAEQGRKISLLLKLLAAVATAAGGSLIAVGKGLYERGTHEGADAVRLEHVEFSIKDIWQDIRSRDRAPRGFDPSTSDRAGWLVPPIAPAPAPKDKP